MMYNLLLLNLSKIKRSNWMLACMLLFISIFVIPYYYSSLKNWTDAALIIFGLQTAKGLPFILILVYLLPSAFVAILVDGYIEHAIIRTMPLTLLRIRSLSKWLLSHLIGLSIVHFIYIILYFTCAIIVLNLHYDGQQFDLTTFCLLFICKFVGALTISLVQLVLHCYIKLKGVPFLIIICIYILTLSGIFSWFGAYIYLGQINFMNATIFVTSVYMAVCMLTIILSCIAVWKAMKKRHLYY